MSTTPMNDPPKLIVIPRLPSYDTPKGDDFEGCDVAEN
jgi:hypothetical protein